MTLANTVNRSNTTPAAPSGTVNVEWQDDGGAPVVNVSAYVPAMVGDTGSGGTAGLAPAPPAGSAAAGKFLKADGTFAVPPGSGSGTLTQEEVTFSGTSGTLAHTPISIYGGYRNGVFMRSVGGGTPDYSITGAAATLAVAAGGSDVFIFVYTY